MRGKYWKYELGRWVGFLIICAGAIMLCGAESVPDNRQMIWSILYNIQVMLQGYLLYKVCKYKEMLIRAKRKCAQERQLQKGA